MASSTRVSFADALSKSAAETVSAANSAIVQEVALSSGPVSRVDTISSGSASCVTLPSTSSSGGGPRSFGSSGTVMRYLFGFWSCFLFLFL